MTVTMSSKYYLHALGLDSCMMPLFQTISTQRYQFLHNSCDWRSNSKSQIMVEVYCGTQLGIYCYSGDLLGNHRLHMSRLEDPRPIQRAPQLTQEPDEPSRHPTRLSRGFLYSSRTFLQPSRELLEEHSCPTEPSRISPEPSREPTESSSVAIEWSRATSKLHGRHLTHSKWSLDPSR